jgi:hypothetical protein
VDGVFCIDAIPPDIQFELRKGLNCNFPHLLDSHKARKATTFWSRLAAEFPDFFMIPLPGEGPTSCFPMIMIMDNGKMNPLGAAGVRGGDAPPEPAALYGPHGVLPLLPGGTSPARRRPASASASSGTAYTSSRASTRRDRWSTTRSSTGSTGCSPARA